MNIAVCIFTHVFNVENNGQYYIKTDFILKKPD